LNLNLTREIAWAELLCGFAAGVKKLVEGAQLFFCEVWEEIGGHGFDLGGDLLQETGAGGCKLDADDAAVFGAWASADEAGGFGALEQAGDVGGFSDEADGDVALRDAVGAGAGDDAEHVVLRRGEAELAEMLLQAVVEDGGRAGDVEQDLLLERLEWFALADFFLEGWRHRWCPVYGCARAWFGASGGEKSGLKEISAD